MIDLDAIRERDRECTPRSAADWDRRALLAYYSRELEQQVARAEDWHRVADARSAEIIRLQDELQKIGRAGPRPAAIQGDAGPVTRKLPVRKFCSCETDPPALDPECSVHGQP